MNLNHGLPLFGLLLFSLNRLQCVFRSAIDSCVLSRPIGLYQRSLINDACFIQHVTFRPMYSSIYSTQIENIHTPLNYLCLYPTLQLLVLGYRKSPCIALVVIETNNLIDCLLKIIYSDLLRLRKYNIVFQ